MKKLMLIFLFTFGVIGVYSQTVENNEADVEAIKKVIQTAYVEGLQNEGNFEKIDSGFYPDFELLGIGENGELTRYSLEEWKANIRIKLETGKLPRAANDLISIKFLFVDVTGTAAVAKFEFYVGEKLVFIDYQSLYKFADEWKIVSKTYFKIEN